MRFKHDVTERCLWRSDLNTTVLIYDVNAKTLGAIFQEFSMFL